MEEPKVQITITHKIINYLSLGIIVVMIGFLLVGWSSLPDQIAGHYNLFGEVDRWGSKWEMLLYPISVMIFYLIFTLIEKYPSQWNVPNSSKPENTEEVYKITKNILCFTKLAIILIMTFTFFCTFFGKPLPQYFMIIYITTLLVAIIYAVVRMYVTADKK